MDQTQVLKGILDTAVLAALQDRKAYGYDLVRRLRESGLTEVAEASVYGTLRRLYSGGFLTSEIVASAEGPARRYYGLNSAGRAELARSARTWVEVVKVIDRLLDRGVE
jgi:PadR family transcriptional regulator, regulatory protein PadR